MSKDSNWKNVVAGATSGFCLTVVGHPFDLVKVRLQTSKQFTGVFDCVKKTFSNEGIRGFYKGVSSPLVSNLFLNSIVFSSFNFMKQFQKEQNKKTIFLSGSFAGLVSSIFVSPFERMKILSQVQYSSSYNGPLTMAIQVFKENGLKGMFRGLSANISRDMVGRGVYFSTYEYLKSKNISTFIAGGITGMVTWVVIIPLDTLKSKIQSEKNTQLGMIDNTKKILKEQSWRGLYRGVTPILLRSFPANAAAFFGYEMVMEVLR
jgi:solute carrier family 25 (mitochondrial carnitine/acylcarnitine transporter), member 20/29